jgi:hypothetical protein
MAKKQGHKIIREVMVNGVVKTITIDHSTGQYYEVPFDQRQHTQPRKPPLSYEDTLIDLIDEQAALGKFLSDAMKAEEKQKVNELDAKKIAFPSNQTKLSDRQSIQIKNPLTTGVMYSFRFPLSDGSFIFYTLADDGFYYNGGKISTKKSIDELLKML